MTQYCGGTGECPISINQEVFIIESPLSGKPINIWPLLSLLQKHYDGDVTKMAWQIDSEIRLLIELIPDEGNLVQFKNLISRKYKHRDAFLQAKCG